MFKVPYSVKGNLLIALRYLLKPLVRLALKNGLTFADFSEALKQAYVDVTARQLTASGMKSNEEGIALMANINAADVREILRSPIEPQFDQDNPQGSSIAKLLSVWNKDPRYSGPYGVLIDLPFDSSQNDRPGLEGRSFAELVEETNPGSSAQTMLEECLRIGCVVSVGNGFYRPLQRSHVPPPLSQQSIGHFAHVVHNVCETCEKNLRVESADGRGLFERRIFTDTPITAATLKEFDRYVRSRGQLFADDIDNWLVGKGTPAEDKAATIHTGIGLYHYVLNDEDEQDLFKHQESGN